MLQPPSHGRFVWFPLICSLMGGSIVAVVTLDTVLVESRKKTENTRKIAYSVTSFPVWICSRDGRLCRYGRLEYDLLACFVLLIFLAFYVSHFLLAYPINFLFFLFVRLCGSHRLSSSK